MLAWALIQTLMFYLALARSHWWIAGFDARGEWIMTTPIPRTIVVNIGDFLQRVSNDRFVSTVHRVFSRVQSDRISMPFFFRFNFNEKVGVLESCLSDGEVAQYLWTAESGCRLGLAKQIQVRSRDLQELL
ncbi:Clavaminate synthase-like protein [Cadophora sp. DSE1049]|nr:Clavaminate synthase-like protein [Cadophora sp. DSE1049]